MALVTAIYTPVGLRGTDKEREEKKGGREIEVQVEGSADSEEGTAQRSHIALSGLRGAFLYLIPVFNPSMPCILLPCSLRAAAGDYRLVLNVSHRMLVGESSEPVYNMKKSRFPEAVDVFLDSNLVLTLSGTLDRVKISPKDMLKSQLAQHLADYLSLVHT